MRRVAGQVSKRTEWLPAENSEKKHSRSRGRVGEGGGEAGRGGLLMSSGGRGVGLIWYFKYTFRPGVAGNMGILRIRLVSSVLGNEHSY